MRAGVGRQYPETLGRTDNRQIGVFSGYATRNGRPLADGRLDHLTKVWFEAGGADRHRRAAVPAVLGCRTKPGEYGRESSGRRLW